MEFTIETVYNQKALTALARGLRRTIRKKRSRRSHIIGWIVVIFGLLSFFIASDESFVITGKTVIAWLATALIFIVLIWEDAINGYTAGKRMLPGTEKAVSVFGPEGYCSTTDIGKTEWYYDKINIIAEGKDYFVFVFNMSHGQVYDKGNIVGGTLEEFRAFLEDKTGKQIQKI